MQSPVIDLLPLNAQHPFVNACGSSGMLPQSEASIHILSMLDKLSKRSYPTSYGARKEGLMSLGTYLRALRESRQLTLRAVQEQCGMSNAYLSQIETGKIRRPSPSVLYKLSEVYSVSYDELMRRAGYPVPDAEVLGLVAPIANSRSRRTGQASPQVGRFPDITPDEEESLLEYLAFLRSRKNR